MAPSLGGGVVDTSADRIADVRVPRTPYGPGAAWPSRTDTHLADGRAVIKPRSTCRPTRTPPPTAPSS